MRNVSNANCDFVQYLVLFIYHHFLKNDSVSLYNLRYENVLNIFKKNCCYYLLCLFHNFSAKQNKNNGSKFIFLNTQFKISLNKVITKCIQNNFTNNSIDNQLFLVNIRYPNMLPCHYSLDHESTNKISS